MTTEGSLFVQYAAALCVTLSLVYHGMTQAWPSPVFPKLLSGETAIQITKEQCSWLASLVALGGPPGCLLAQYLGDKIGRKKTILLLAVPGIVGSGMMTFVTTPILMYIARVICGCCAAIAIVEISIYIGEISDKRIRGTLGSLITGMANLGNLIMYGVGPFVSYDTINWICLSGPVIFLLSSLWIPESPYYHLKNGDMEKAGKAMMQLNGLKTTESIDEQLREMQVQVKSHMEKKTTYKELLTKKEYRKAVIAMFGLKMLQQMTGTLAIQAYLETIFRSTSMTISGPTASIIYGSIQFVAGFIATVLVDKMGRKPLLIISSLGTGLCLTIVGIYFYMQNVLNSDSATMSAVSWFPIIGILGFNVLFAIGIGNLPYVLQSELFPTNVKSVASSFFSIIGSTMAFSVAKMYQGLVDHIGIHMVFWIFAFFGYSGVLFVYFYVPETKGKSLEDIILKLNRAKGEKNIKNEENLLQDVKA